ncbi:MAG: rhodanese-like domain-containing protein [Brachymonas sp.]|nr:rhodanese-like domain-containing protein [Brachymonas sp.]
MPTSATDFAGHVTPHEAHDWQQKGEAVIVDVRTQAERDWVGSVPGALGLSWVEWPNMQFNAAFDEGIVAIAQAHPDKKILLLCRSGVRSVAAAQRATALGVAQCYNILEGFEGAPDENRHRSTCNGWRYHGLPWVQG